VKSFDEFVLDLIGKMEEDPIAWSSSLRIVEFPDGVDPNYIKALEIVHDKVLQDSFRQLVAVLREYHQEYLAQGPDC